MCYRWSRFIRTRAAGLLGHAQTTSFSTSSLATPSTATRFWKGWLSSGKSWRQSLQKWIQPVSHPSDTNQTLACFSVHCLFTRVTLFLCSHCQGDKPYQAEVWSYAYRKWPPGCCLCPQQASQHLQIRHIRLHRGKHHGTHHSCQARCQRHFLLGQVSLKSLFKY